MEVRVSKKNPVPNTQKMKKLEPLVAEKLWDKTRNLKMLQKTTPSLYLLQLTKAPKHFIFLYYTISGTKPKK